MRDAHLPILIALSIVCMLLAACAPAAVPAITPTRTPTRVPPTNTPATSTATPRPTATSTPTPLPTVPPAPIPAQQVLFPFKADLVAFDGSPLADHAEYLLYVPADYDPASGQTYPLIVFLHGGNAPVDAAIQAGLPGLIAADHLPEVPGTDEFPFMVLSPLMPFGGWWENNLDYLNALLDNVLATYPVDPERVTLTGFSMGGGGVWWWGIDAPERFAGIAPVAGDAYNLPDQPGFPGMMCPLAGTPIWVFHSVGDGAAPFSRMIEIAEAVEGCGGEVRVLASRTLSHDRTWGWAYTRPDLYAWLLDPVQ